MTASPQVTEVEIPAELLARLEALPDAKSGARKAMLTPEQDAMLLKYWPTKRKDDVAAIVGYCKSVCRKRYKLLTEVKHGND